MSFSEIYRGKEIDNAGVDQYDDFVSCHNGTTPHSFEREVLDAISLDFENLLTHTSFEPALKTFSIVEWGRGRLPFFKVNNAD